MSLPYKIIDLTHTLDKNIPCWDTSCGFQQNITLDYADCNPHEPFRVQHLKMNAGIGTHMDAPAHCNPKGLTIDQLPLETLISPCIVIDTSSKMHERYSVSLQDIESHESIYGIIPPKTFLIIRTGWEQFWATPEKYHNQHIFPSLSLEAAQFLLKREIVGLGIDTLSPDRPEDGYPVHMLLLNAGKYIVENVANSAALPIVGSYAFVIPIKIKDGTEAPIRLIGLIL